MATRPNSPGNGLTKLRTTLDKVHKAIDRHGESMDSSAEQQQATADALARWTKVMAFAVVAQVLVAIAVLVATLAGG